MKHYNGKPIYKGIAIATVKVLKKIKYDTSKKEISDIEAETKRYEKARDTAVQQLQTIYKKVLKDIGEETAAIFDVQSMLLMDDDYNDSVHSMIQEEKVNAEYAVYKSGETIAKVFSEMEDEYMRVRADDIKDISRRIITILCGGEDASINSDEPKIIAANDLTPAEIVQLDKNKILAFITKDGSSQSHTAILARTMNIPAVTGIIIDNEWDGKFAIVDAFSGEVILEPDEKILEEKELVRAKFLENQKLLQNLKGKEDVTKDGRHINLYANIGSVQDADLALENDAQGIGLFRSEFLYLGRSTYPTEEEQFVAYKNVARKMNGKKVIIRTLDIGADKQADYFDLEHEENPALGLRAIRICLERPDLFKRQLRAIYRASAFGNIAIMYPMVISVDEVLKAKQIAAEVRATLDKEDIEYKNIEQGIMIETPAAVLISDELAKEVDFFSLGTNDLTQYLLAIDRQNSKLENFYNPHHPAVLRAIQTTIENGHKHGCSVGICGEIGADLELTEKFIKMGIDEISVSPSAILPVREMIRSVSLGTRN